MNRHGKHIIVALLLGMAFQGCYDNSAIRIRYNLEKQLFEIEKAAREVHASYGYSTADAFAGVRFAYRDLVKDCYLGLESIEAVSYPTEYNEVEDLTFRSTSRLSQYLFTARDYDACQDVISHVLESIRLDGVELMITHYNLGRALQAGGNWDSATAVYDTAVSRFYPPLSDDGAIVFKLFNLPLHLYQVALRIGNNTEASRRFDLAENYYRWVSTDFPNSDLFIASNTNLARMYEQAERYLDAIEQLGRMVDSNGAITLTAHLRIADLYAFRLNEQDRALQIYKLVEQDLPDNNDSLAPTILLKQGLVYLHKREYSKARRLLVQLSRNYPDFYFETPSAQLAKAQTFDREGNWGRAESEYRYLIENYGGSDEAMSTYLYLARHFDQQGRRREAEAWYQRAQKHYAAVAQRRIFTEDEAKALSYQAELYRQRNDWLSAAEILITIFEKFPNSPIGHRALLTAARVYAAEPGERSKADSLMQALRNALTEVDDDPDIYDL